jgi:signal transduction histidine kinase
MIDKNFKKKSILIGLIIFLISLFLFLDLIIFTKIFWIKIVKIINLFLFIVLVFVLIINTIKKGNEKKEKEKLVKKLEKLNLELKKADENKTEFVSIASHQLRTPLTAIKGYLSMIIDGTYGFVPEKIKEKLGNVFESNERLVRLVNELLSVSRIETGKIELVLEKQDIEKTINQVISELNISAKNKKLKINFIKPKNKTTKILIDIEKIRQVLINIIDNAIKYTNSGKITIYLEEKDKEVLIKVSDTGEGMEKEEIKKIFNSFSRGGAGERFSGEGSGLGLYIARKFIKMHKGKIYAKSEGRGKGSCFYINLPINN